MINTTLPCFFSMCGLMTLDCSSGMCTSHAGKPLLCHRHPHKTGVLRKIVRSAGSSERNYDHPLVLFRTCTSFDLIFCHIQAAMLQGTPLLQKRYIKKICLQKLGVLPHAVGFHFECLKIVGKKTEVFTLAIGNICTMLLCDVNKQIPPPKT